MSGDLFDAVKFAAPVALAMAMPEAAPALAAEGAGAAGAGALATDALAPSLLGNAFGSADMLAAGAAGGLGSAAGAAPYFGAGLFGDTPTAATEALPSMTADAPIPYSPNMASIGNPYDNTFALKLEANGMTPNSFTGGYDSLNGFGRFGQRLQDFGDKMGNFRMPSLQSQPQNQRPHNPIPNVAPKKTVNKEPSDMPPNYSYSNNSSYTPISPEIEQIIKEAQLRMMTSGFGGFRNGTI